MTRTITNNPHTCPAAPSRFCLEHPRSYALGNDRLSVRSIAKLTALLEKHPSYANQWPSCFLRDTLLGPKDDSHGIPAGRFTDSKPRELTNVGWQADPEFSSRKVVAFFLTSSGGR